MHYTGKAYSGKLTPLDKELEIVFENIEKQESISLFASMYSYLAAQGSLPVNLTYGRLSARSLKKWTSDQKEYLEGGRLQKLHSQLVGIYNNLFLRV